MVCATPAAEIYKAFIQAVGELVSYGRISVRTQKAAQRDVPGIPHTGRITRNYQRTEQIMASAVEVSHLVKKFGAFIAVNDISFEVREGEIFGFLGPNGAGKSTTIKMLCGIHAPTSGDGRVAGHDIMREQSKIKTSIGYMSQKFSLYDDLTVRENFEFFGSVYGISGETLRGKIDSIMKETGIDARKDMLCAKLPGGIKQRIALGCAILHEPPILFLDEPTSGVDPLVRRSFWDMIHEFADNGRTIFVTTHYMDEAEHCGRIALIIAGNLIALDSPSALKEALPHKVYVIRSNDFMRLFEATTTMPFVRETAIFGSDVHIMCDETRGIEKMILAELAKQGFHDVEISKAMPSLEDVFVVHARKFE